ncbi:hypothetical protein JCM5353_002081 [Sporobolomyces roseus]
MDSSIYFQVTYATSNLPLSLPPSTPISSFLSLLSSHFSINPTTSKLLSKGKKLSIPSTSDTDETLLEFLEQNGLTSSTQDPSKPLKLLLIASRSSSLESLKSAEQLREKKRLAFEHHQSLAQFSKPLKSGGVHGIGEDDEERYRFLNLEPFPRNVPCFEKREAMLKRLSEDPAVREVMKKHKFVVGTLTELHPILQPTLLGLNTNAGEKVALRLLTNDLEGTRSYNEVRRVLLHELAHNKFGPHDDDFKALNSELNKEVSNFESSPYFEPWSPTSSSSTESPNRRTEHRLNEEESERVWDKLRFGQEELVDEKRERVGNAAEERMKREKAERSQ